MFARAMALREALHRIFKATMTGRPPQGLDLKTLNDELLEARSHESLTHAENGFMWEWVSSDSALDRMLWAIAHSAAELLSKGDLSRLRQCGGEECGWLLKMPAEIGAANGVAWRTAEIWKRFVAFGRVCEAAVKVKR